MISRVNVETPCISTSEASRVLDPRGSPFMSLEFGDMVGTGTNFTKPSKKVRGQGELKFWGILGQFSSIHYLLRREQEQGFWGKLGIPRYSLKVKQSFKHTLLLEMS